MGQKKSFCVSYSSSEVARSLLYSRLSVALYNFWKTKTYFISKMTVPTDRYHVGWHSPTTTGEHGRTTGSTQGAKEGQNFLPFG